MKIFSALRSGITRASVSWKGALIMWFVMIMLTLMISGPAKGLIRSSLGESMIVEKLATHMDLEVFRDPGMHLNLLLSVIARGILILIPLSILINAFLTGGLFNSLKVSAGRFSPASFWKSSAEYFWPFLVITLIMTLIFIALGLIVIGIPVAIVSSSENMSDASVTKTAFATIIAMFFISVVPVLAADYARAWLVSSGEKRPFNAIGHGFSQTFRNFASSWIMMVIIFVIQLFYIWLVMRIVTRMSASTQGEVILLFLVSQLLFFGRLFLKLIRYGSVTALLEINVRPDDGGTSLLDDHN